MFCKNCGAEVRENQAVCLNCGAAISEQMQNGMGTNSDPSVSDKSWLATLLICFFVGGFGIHRFYVGKVGTGLLWLFTFGLCGIGTLVDFIMILCKSFKDNEGKLIKN